MSTLYITEYAQVARDSLDNSVLCPQEPPIAEQVITISGSSTQCTNAFNADTKFVRIHTDAICSVLFGTNPTATTSKGRMVAGQTEFRGVDKLKNGGNAMKCAVISNT